MAEALQINSGGSRSHSLKILSARGGALEASPRLRRFIAIFEDGRTLATPAALDDPEFQMLQRHAASGNIRLRKPEVASLDQIAAANAKVGDVAEFVTQARHAFFSILERAAMVHASDVLISRSGEEAEVRLRVDGLMRNDRKLEPDRATAISNAAFHACDAGDSLAITTRAVRAAITNRKFLPGKVQGVRLQYAPTATGFVLVLRIAYASSAIHCRTLEEAGYGQQQTSVIRSALQSSAGVFVVAGPTEHGKSTTLNLAIEEFARGYAQFPNIVAVEDPPETQHIPYIQSFSVNTSIESEEAAFEGALLAALRLAPDGIKIGELRDNVSARTAYRAAGSGALVFSTLHAAFATDIPFRLMDLGVERYRAFDHLNILWIAQRLVPSACRSCSYSTRNADSHAYRALLADAERLQISLGKARFAGSGCNACAGTGFVGRALVSEVVAPDHKLLETGLDPGATRQSFRRAWLQHGGSPITVDAFQFVRTGQISLDAFVRNVAAFESLVFDVQNVGARP